MPAGRREPEPQPDNNAPATIERRLLRRTQVRGVKPAFDPFTLVG
jgi:hypothetical protein